MMRVDTSREDEICEAITCVLLNHGRRREIHVIFKIYR